MHIDKREDENMGEGFDAGMLAGLLGNKGIDPGVVALLNEGKEKGWNDGALILLFLVLLFGAGRGWGLGNGADSGVAGVDRTVVNEANYSRLLDAMNTNGTRQEMAVQSLAGALNCDAKQIQSALCGMDKQLAVNQGSIVNAIQSCCCTLQGKMDQCCCNTNLNIERTGNSIQSAIQNQNFQQANQFAAQAQLITQKFCDQNAYLADQFCQIKMREDQREIQSLRDKLAEQSQQAQTAIILNAIANKNAVAVSGTLNTTAGTWAGTGSLS